MTKPTQLELVARGVSLLRGIIDRTRRYWPAEQTEALTAVCDLVERTIEIRARQTETAFSIMPSVKAITPETETTEENDNARQKHLGLQLQ